MRVSEIQIDFIINMNYLDGNLNEGSVNEHNKRMAHEK